MPDAYSSAPLMAEHDRSAVGLGLAARAVGRAIVDHDRLEATVPGEPVERPADLAGFVESGEDDCNQGFRRVHDAVLSHRRSLSQPGW